MERRMIAAIVLSLAVVFGWQYIFPPPPATLPPIDNAVVAPAGASLADNAAFAAGSATAGGQTSASPAVGGLAPRQSAPVRSIVVKTPLYTAVVATAGGGIESFSINDQKDKLGPDGKPLNIVCTLPGLPRPLELSLDGATPAFPATLFFASDAPDEVVVAKGEKKPLLLSWESADGVKVVREFVFDGDAYAFEARATVSNGGTAPLSVRPGFVLSQNFTPELANDSYVFSGAVVAPSKGSPEQIDLGEVSKGELKEATVRWAAADAKYFSLILFPEKEYTVTGAKAVGPTGLRFALSDTPAALASGASASIRTKAFFGPKRTELLEELGKDVISLIDYGWFWFIARPMVWALKMANKVTGNFGIDIILLTLLIRGLTHPLNKKQMSSMRKMAELQPVMEKLKVKYKEDPQRMNTELMQVYKTYGVNPLAGCLPMLAQLPIFVALYKGLLVTIDLRHAPFMLWINDLAAPEFLYDINLAGFILPLRLLPLLMGISMFVQQKMTPSTGGDPAQQKIMMFMPVIFTFMFWSMPSGLVIYWLVNNILGIGAQMMFNRKAEEEKKGVVA